MKPNIITPNKLPLRKKKSQNRDNKNIRRQQEGMINGNKDETNEPRRPQDIQDKQDEEKIVTLLVTMTIMMRRRMSMWMNIK